MRDAMGCEASEDSPCRASRRSYAAIGIKLSPYGSLLKSINERAGLLLGASCTGCGKGRHLVHCQVLESALSRKS